jgi:NitT/TauT family transport system permease protein
MTLQGIFGASSSSGRPDKTMSERRLWRRLIDAPGLLPVTTFVAIVAVWQVASVAFGIPSYILPSPTRILGGFAGIDAARWASHIWATLRVALIGYFIAIATSLPIAIMLTRSKSLSRAIYPLLVVIQSTPVVAIAPIVIVVLGAGDAPRIVITWMITFFPLVVSTSTGLVSTPEELIELSRSLRAPAWREITQIRLPYAVPYIFSALKISITLAVIGAVVAEFVAAQQGIGYFIQVSTSFFKLPQAWAGLVVLVCMSLVLFQMVALVQRLVFPWSLPKEAK